MFALYPSLAGKAAVVTGGAQGIGRSIIEHFLDQGMQVASLDLLDTPLHSDRLHSIQVDLRNINSLQEAMMEAENRLGPPSVLVNNAAKDARTVWSEIDVAQWDDLMATNLRHMFFAAQAAAKSMRHHGGGSIINLGSTVNRIAEGRMTEYSTAKAGIEGLTRSLARDLGPDRIRVNCIVPGWVMTERQLRENVTPSGEEEIDRRQCLHERLRPEDVARMALFLAAEDSRLCTGQLFTVDAGWS